MGENINDVIFGAIPVAGSITDKVIAFFSGAAGLQRASISTLGIAFKITGDAFNRFAIFPDGKLKWGTGTGATDTTLERVAPGVLNVNGAAIGGTSIRDSTGAVLARAVIEYGTVTGPASYTTGGFTLDLSARFASLKAVLLMPVAGVSFRYAEVAALDSPAVGKALIRVQIQRETQITSALNTLPTGVTSQSALQNVASEAGHTHTPGSLAMSSSAATTSPVSNALAVDTGGAGTAQQANHAHSHTHPINTGTTASGEAHAHSAPFLYTHGHGTSTVAQPAPTEVVAATDLSTISWSYVAVGAGV
jgi:hypothetical protein